MPPYPLLQLRDVAKDFHAGITGCAARARVLERVDLDVAPGECVAIQGGRAAGKTTLLLCAAGLMRPDRGTVRWCGAPPGAASECAVRYVIDREGLFLVEQAAQAVRTVLLVDESHAPVGARWPHAIEYSLDRVRRHGGAVVIATRGEEAVTRIATRVLVLMRGRLSALALAPEPDSVPARVAEDDRFGARASVDPLSGGT